jgi:hypothetical protein
MKTSIVNFRTLAFGLVMVLSFTCAASLFAAVEDNYVVNQVGNTKFIYTADATGLYLTPKFKYVYNNSNKNTTIKTTLLWSDEQDDWLPYYQITSVSESGVRTMTYATWNSALGNYSNNTERMVYTLDKNNSPISVEYFIWNEELKSWVEK